MPEDTLVNTEVTWPEPETAGLVVREMQTKLHRWAGHDPAQRFNDLYNLVCAPAFLVAAYERVRRNKGARTAGIDRATVAQIESQIGVEAFLGQIRAELKARTFRPVPVREVMIPKASGKMRSLGIPTVADRVVQAALKLVLEPIFEADFQPCSYGFRPRRRAQDAIAEIQHFKTRGYEWVLEADIQACFDEIDHVALMGRIRVRIGDKKVLALVKAFLKAGVMTTTGTRKGTLTGTPQGGILSPLLANIALSVLDDHFVSQWQEQMGTGNQRARRRRQGLGTWRHCRYADLCGVRHKSAFRANRDYSHRCSSRTRPALVNLGRPGDRLELPAAGRHVSWFVRFIPGIGPLLGYEVAKRSGACYFFTERKGEPYLNASGIDRSDSSTPGVRGVFTDQDHRVRKG